MIYFRARTCLLVPIFSTLLVAASTATAQLPQTRLDAIAPVGAKAGSEIDLVVKSGADLDELSGLIFSHPGIKATPKMQGEVGNQKPVTNTFVATIAANVPPGLYEVRATGHYGTSNPRTFVVGNSEEVLEKEANNTKETAQEISLGAAVNGSSSGADFDYYKFVGKKGQRVIVSCQAARIDSKMSAIIECFDVAGRRMGFGSNNVREDPLVDLTLPSDGEYFIKIYDAVFRGGNEYFYRLQAHTGPYIDFIMPSAGIAGTTGDFTVYGRNLPNGQASDFVVNGDKLQKLQVKIALPADDTAQQSLDHLSPAEFAVDGISYVLKSDQGVSNPYLIHFASAPVIVEQEPNDESAKAQKITIPGEFAGNFQNRGDIDYVEFEAKANSVYYIEAFGQRLGSLSDPYLILEQITKSKEGVESVKRISVLDDNATNIGGTVFNSQTDDPFYRFQVPADGVYRLAIRDRFFESRGNANLVYRIAIRQQQPDFRLVAIPVKPGAAANAPGGTGTLALRRGDNVSIDVFAFRKDGYDGEIDLWAEDLPEGVTVSAASIGPKQTSAPLILSATENCKVGFKRIRILGKARIDDPSKVKALTTAEAAIKPAADAIPKLKDVAAKAKAASDKAKAALKVATDALAKKTDDNGLKQKVEAAKKVADTVGAAEKTANDAVVAGEKKLADANAAVAKAEAEKKAASRELTRNARAATIAWTASPTNAVITRTTEAIGVSVITEAAPFQIAAKVGRVVAHQSRQILVPVTVTKRMKIDKDIALAFTGLPKNAQIVVKNDKVTKDQTERLLRIFVNNNAPESTYTIYLTGTCQIPYVRNPERVERAKKAQAEAVKLVTALGAIAKKAVQERDAANKKATDDANKLKQAQAARDNAAKAVTVAEAAAKAAKEDKAKAAAAANLVKAKQTLTDAEKVLVAATTTAKASADDKVKKEAAAKDADAKSKAAVAAKTEADKEVTAATNAAKPKNLNFTPVSDAIVITVKKAPAQLTAAVPGGGALKRGSKIEIKVTVKRVNSFAGPITLNLPLPPNVKGLVAPAVTIPADKSDGIFVINAAGDATEGQLANMVIRGTSNFGGEQAAVDVPVAIKVSK